MPGVTVKDVDQAAVVKAVAEFLKKYVSNVNITSLKISLPIQNGAML